MSKHYPKASYVWRLFRQDFLGKPWHVVKRSFRERRYSGLPKRFQEQGQWWWGKFWLKRYCQLLDGFFRVEEVKGMGLGIFAKRNMKKGSTLLFGHLHRISQKALAGLDKIGECSLMQVSRGRRIDWYNLGGPASLVNHACKRFNAEYVLDEDDQRGSHGEMLVRLTRNVSTGDEILVHYGSEFWKEKICKCKDCSSTSKSCFAPN